MCCAAEQVWREVTRRLSTGDKLKHLFRAAMAVGLSLWWRRYTHVKHREEELLVDRDGPRDGGRGRRDDLVNAKTKVF